MSERCEPPEHLRGVVGLHILLTPAGEEDAGKWRGPEMGWWFGGHMSMTATAAAELGWSYLRAVPSADAVAKLVAAAREVASEFAQGHPLIMALRAALRSVAGEAGDGE